MLARRAHHEQPRPMAMDRFEDDVGGRRGAHDRMEAVADIVGRKVTPRARETALGFGGVGSDGEELDGLVAGEAEQRERLEHARDVPPGAVRDEHALAVGGVAGHVVDVRLPAGHDDIAGHGLEDDLLVRRPDVLDRRARDAGLVATAAERRLDQRKT